jgi:fructose-specific phosphotransferase system IIC component
MQFLLERSALRVREVPISVQYLDGNKRNPVLHGLRVVEAILTLVARRRPLLFLGLPGLGLMILGFLLGVSVIHVINHRHAVPTGTTVLSSMLIMLGLVLVVTAVILNTLEHFMVRLQQELRDSLRQVSDVVRRKRP